MMTFIANTFAKSNRNVCGYFATKEWVDLQEEVQCLSCFSLHWDGQELDRMYGLLKELKDFGPNFGTLEVKFVRCTTNNC